LETKEDECGGIESMDKLSLSSISWDFCRTLDPASNILSITSPIVFFPSGL